MQDVFAPTGNNHTVNHRGGNNFVDDGNDVGDTLIGGGDSNAVALNMSLINSGMTHRFACQLAGVMTFPNATTVTGFQSVYVIRAAA